MLSGPSHDPTRQPLTPAQTELFKALDRARTKRAKCADTLDALDDQYLKKPRKALADAQQAESDAMLALAKALEKNGHRCTPTGDALEVSVDWKEPSRTLRQPTWQVNKAARTYSVIIGEGKEAIKLTQKIVDEEATAKLPPAPPIRTFTEAEVIAQVKATKAKSKAKRSSK